jgi:RNA polymerase sigma-70 factor (ECF subfamily)
MSKSDHKLALFLYEIYKDSLYTLARRYLLDNESAMDVIQDFFVKVFEKSSKIPEGEAALPYMYRMAVNMCIDVLRKRKKVTALPDNLQYSSGTVELFENRDTVDALMEELNEDQRLMVVLSDILELPVKEISMITGENEGTIRTRLSRARDCMKESADKRGILR